MSEEVANFIQVELTSIIDDCGIPSFSDDERRRLDVLEQDLKDAIREGRYPIASLLEIRRIYSKRRNHGNEDD